jgi:hypothetical protein
MLHCTSVAETDEMKSRMTGENKTLGKKLVAVPLEISKQASIMRSHHLTAWGSFMQTALS